MEWISIENRPPAIGQKVIFYSPKHGEFMLIVTQGIIDDDFKFVGYNEEGVAFCERITHWMLVPSAPK